MEEDRRSLATRARDGAMRGRHLTAQFQTGARVAVAAPSYERLEETRVVEEFEVHLEEGEWASVRKTWPWRTHLFFPVETWKRVWDFMILIYIVYSAVYLPFAFCFNVPLTGALVLIEMVMEVVLLLDILFSFNTSILDHHRWVLDRKRIAISYLAWPSKDKSVFWIDAPGAVPLELLAALHATGSIDIGTFLADSETLRLLRLVRLIRVIRLLNVADNSTMQLLTQRFHAASGVSLLRIMELVHSCPHSPTNTDLRTFNPSADSRAQVVLMSYCVHLLGCCWFLLGMASVDDASDAPFATGWLAKYEEGYLLSKEATTAEKYVVACLWAMGMITGLNSHIQPHSFAEYWYAMMAHLISALVLAYVIAGVTEEFAKSRLSAPPVEDVKKFVKWKNLPKGLATQVMDYAESFWADRQLSRVREEAVMSSLRPKLQQEIYQHVMKDSIDPYNIISSADYGLNDEFKQLIYYELMPVFFLSGNVIISAGERMGVIYFLRQQRSIRGVASNNKSCVGASMHVERREDDHARFTKSRGLEEMSSDYQLNKSAPTGIPWRTFESVPVVDTNHGRRRSYDSVSSEDQYNYFGEESWVLKMHPYFEATHADEYEALTDVEYRAASKIECFSLSVDVLRRHARSTLLRTEGWHGKQRLILDTILGRLHKRRELLREVALEVQNGGQRSPTAASAHTIRNHMKKQDELMVWLLAEKEYVEDDRGDRKIFKRSSLQGDRESCQLFEETSTRGEASTCGGASTRREAAFGAASTSAFAPALRFGKQSTHGDESELSVLPGRHAELSSKVATLGEESVVPAPARTLPPPRRRLAAQDQPREDVTTANARMQMELRKHIDDHTRATKDHMVQILKPLEAKLEALTPLQEQLDKLSEKVTQLSAVQASLGFPEGSTALGESTGGFSRHISRGARSLFSTKEKRHRPTTSSADPPPSPTERTAPHTDRHALQQVAPPHSCRVGA